MQLIGLIGIILIMIFIILLVKFWEIWAVIIGVIVVMGVIGLIYEYKDEIGKIVFKLLVWITILGLIFGFLVSFK
ncbi:hypothetical protein [Campylobacter armoricus]|uniref:hypothetical protein n=1 Tax=Campylobacter armoricus TaxID=2505970 RepID=UPI001116401F|nr:hypothetical protein [Campylobacter armoricus]